MKVLFVCLGNICRSPAAEGIFRRIVQTNGLEGQVTMDSAGTGGWHQGEPPDARMIEHARNRGYDLSTLRARQFHPVHDFSRFDLILTMDESNMNNVLRMTKDEEHRLKVKPMTSYCKIHSVSEVPDPYYKEEDGFELVLDILEDACTELFESIKEKVQ